MLIVFEGVDGSGKSTHARLLAKWLRSLGKRVFLTSEPTQGPVGALIRGALSGRFRISPKTFALLFTADRCEHVLQIRKALEKGDIVVSDRYYHSTVAYQAAQGVERDWLLRLNSFAPKPDIVFYLDLHAKEAESRAKSGEIFERRDFLEKVGREYLKFRGMKVLDASAEKRAVQEKIRAIVSERIHR